MNWIATAGIIIAMFTFLLMAIFGGLELWCYFENLRERWRWDAARKHFESEMFQLARWCSFDFPVLEDVTREFVEASNQGICVDMQSFRAKLRKKYKEVDENETKKEA